MSCVAIYSHTVQSASAGFVGVSGSFIGIVGSALVYYFAHQASRSL